MIPGLEKIIGEIKMKRFTAAVMAVTLVFAAGAALPYTDKTDIAITASAAEMRTGKCGEGL